MKLVPQLDPGFLPAVLFNREFEGKTTTAGDAAISTAFALHRTDGTVSVRRFKLLPYASNRALNLRYAERMLKFLLWQRGGWKVQVLGCPELVRDLQQVYRPGGERGFDYDFVRKVYAHDMQIENVNADEFPQANEVAVPLGRNLDGNRIGFDLGGSDRKCAAVIDGKVVYSEEIPWDPYFQQNPEYHYEGIQDSLKKAAAHLPRVDAIGGSAAGVYVNNEVRAASLFRGVAEDLFRSRVVTLFKDIAKEWGVPMDVINDGDVTALAAAMSLNENAVLGVAMGTSEAVGYVNADGNITSWLNELAFAPVDYRAAGAPVDEWSGDAGCGVQFFSQQGVGRLIPAAGISEISAELPLPEKLVEVQKLMAKGDERARKIYDTLGVCFGYTIAHYADFYEIRNLLILGRVTSGDGGELLLQRARDVLDAEFPELSGIKLVTPDEKDKRHGQAVAAASLPRLH